MEIYAYEHICMINRYTFGELEKLTALINHYRKAGICTNELTERRYRMKYQLETNLERMMIAREREMIDEKEKENTAA